MQETPSHAPHVGTGCLGHDANIQRIQRVFVFGTGCVAAWTPVDSCRPKLTAEAGDAQGLQIIARSSMNLGVAAEGNAPPVVLHAKAHGGCSGVVCGGVGWR